MSKQEVYDRDKGECFYCGKELTIEQASYEHILAKVHGGTNTNYNTTIACRSCNSEVSSLPIVEKVRIRDIKRMFDTNKPAKVTTITIGDVIIKTEERK